VELARILCVKVSCHLQGHFLVEHGQSFMACSPESRVRLCGVGGLYGPHPSNVDVLLVIRKELQEYILMSSCLHCGYFYPLLVSLLALLLLACL
jgi:hypothetical protein